MAIAAAVRASTVKNERPRVREYFARTRFFSGAAAHQVVKLLKWRKLWRISSELEIWHDLTWRIFYFRQNITVKKVFLVNCEKAEKYQV